MTDRQKWEKHLTDQGVEYDVEDDGSLKIGGYGIGHGKQGEKVNGYKGFYTLIKFDNNGNLVEFGIWE